MDLPIPVKKQENVTDSCLGRRRTLDTLDKREIAFLAVGCLSLLACIGLTIERLIYLAPNNCPHDTTPSTGKETDRKCGAEFTFALLILINCLFCVYHVFHGVIWERPYELYIFSGSILLVTCYCIIDFAVGVHDGMPTNSYPFQIKLARLIILILMGGGDLVLGCWIAAIFLRTGRFACNLVQTYDEVIQGKCKLHFFTQSLLTFDLEFQITMIILILRNGFELTVSGEELGILITGCVFSVIWIVAANLSLRFENTFLSWFVLITSVLEPAYIIYKIQDSAKILHENQSSDDISKSIHYAVFLGGSLGIILRVILTITFYKTYKDFGTGLNERIYGKPPEIPFKFNGLKVAEVQRGSVNN